MRRSLRSPAVTAQYLLEGTAYALEQGGLLLHDCVLLYRNEKYASAAAIALFAIEEIGRSRLLHSLWNETVENGRTFTVQAIRLQCGNHVVKQTQGLSSPTLYVNRGDNKLNQLLTATDVKQATPESIRASAEIQAIGERLNQRLPNQRHDWRQKSLYVEPSQLGSTWNRPKDQPKQIAFDSMFGAYKAYSWELCRFTRTGSFKNEAPAFYSALEAWKERPKLPSQLSVKEIEDLWKQIQ